MNLWMKTKKNTPANPIGGHLTCFLLDTKAKIQKKKCSIICFIHCVHIANAMNSIIIYVLVFSVDSALPLHKFVCMLLIFMNRTCIMQHVESCEVWLLSKFHLGHVHVDTNEHIMTCLGRQPTITYMNGWQQIINVRLFFFYHLRIHSSVVVNHCYDHVLVHMKIYKMKWRWAWARSIDCGEKKGEKMKTERKMDAADARWKCIPVYPSGLCVYVSGICPSNRSAAMCHRIRMLNPETGSWCNTEHSCPPLNWLHTVCTCWREKSQWA